MTTGEHMVLNSTLDTGTAGEHLVMPDSGGTETVVVNNYRVFSEKVLVDLEPTVLIKDTLSSVIVTETKPVLIEENDTIVEILGERITV